MKNKDYSRLGKLLIATVAFGLCLLKWFGVLPSAPINEIWTSAAWCYGIMLGTMDANIILDNMREPKDGK